MASNCRSRFGLRIRLGTPEAADGDFDDTNSVEVTVMITVTDVNEPPEFTSGEETYTIDENAEHRWRATQYMAS